MTLIYAITFINIAYALLYYVGNPALLLDDLLAVDLDVLGHKAIDKVMVEGALLGSDVEVLESEVGEMGDLLLLLGIEEDVALDIAAAHDDVVGIGLGCILAALEVVELCPTSDEEEVLDRASDVLDCDVLVLLWGVGTALDPEEVVGLGRDVDAA